MRAQANRSEDKKYLRKLLKALDVSESRLKVDECGDWNITGLRGHIFTDGDSWYLFVSPESVRKWNIIKKQLSFMVPHQDGHDEGILKCDRMPFLTEALEVRKVIGVRPTKKLTDEQREVLKNRLRSPDRMGVSSLRIDLNEEEVAK